MSMKKYTSPEKVEVFYGEEAAVVNRHLKRVGKAISDFSEEEKEALSADLEKAQEKEAAKEAARAEKEAAKEEK